MAGMSVDERKADIAMKSLEKMIQRIVCYSIMAAIIPASLVSAVIFCSPFQRRLSSRQFEKKQITRLQQHLSKP